MSLSCCGIACIEDDLCEMDHDSIATRVRIDDVRRVTLGHGYQSPHHIVRAVIGGLLILPGFVALWHLIRGNFGLLDAILIAAALVGIWLIFTALAKGYYLDIQTTQGRNRLLFDANATPSQLQTFLPTLDIHLAVPIESKVTDVPFTSSR